MGIAISELLALDYFKECEVLAGRNGLNKEIQGVTVMDAPDAYHWTKGKELSISSGYVIAQEPDCIYKAFEEGMMQRLSGLMIKKGRYYDHVPQKMLELFDEYDIPLITLPFHIPYMEAMSQVNTAVMNRTIRRFRINNTGSYLLSNVSYKEQKIRRILQAVEAEMKFPAFLFDFIEEKSYYSSANFRRIADSYGLKDEDFWEPSMEYTKHTLCDYIEMTRYRIVETSNEEAPRVSWIRIPISMNGGTQAVFVVMESRELLDYYDEYAIRIAFLMLQGVYEQLMSAQNMGNVGFENFVLYALTSTEKDEAKLKAQANAQGISLSTKYIYIIFGQRDSKQIISDHRREIMEVFQKCKMSQYGKLAIVGENEGVFFIEFDENAVRDKEKVRGFIKEFHEKIEENYPELELVFGVSMEETPITGLKKCVEKCRKTVEMGKMILPEKYVWEYEQLGPIVWLQIPKEELDKMLQQYRELMKDEKNIELLRTLKVYLENNMNYSVTADQMFVHINTIRKRIDKINGILGIDWEDRMAKMNTEILLNFLEL